MKILYVDNFRGFEDTYISLKDVNFLVGENSTGKTSILSLINLLHSSTFWTNHEFNNDEVNLGSFDEIITKHSEKDYFQIGFFNYTIDLDSTGENSKHYASFVIKFIDINGIPAPSEFKYVDNDQSLIVSVSKSRKSVRYKVKNVTKKSINLLEPDEIFKHWLQSMSSVTTTAGYKRLNINPEIAKSVSFMKFLVDVSIQKNTNEDVQLDFLDFAKVLSAFNLQKMFIWIDPIRAKPKRTYDNYGIGKSPEGNHTPYLLKDILTSGKQKNKECVEHTLKSFGADSGLFESITIKNYSTGNQSPFEIDINLNDNYFKISNVGYGVSQVLPIIVELIASTHASIENTFAIQQPEVHLHPRAQAALGDLIYHTCSSNSKKFIIETHSDYLIDRFRLKVHDNKNDEDKNINSQVLFFERSDNGNKITVIDIEKSGKYAENQPASFMDFFIKEDLNLLVI